MRTAIVFLALLLTACATDQAGVGTMLPGRIISLSDGTTFPMQYELSSGSGRMTAANPITGEQFAGTYTALLESHVVQHSQTSFFGDQDTGQSVETSDVAQGSAVLVGNKGTVLNLKMHVKVGNPPTGFGEGEDNRGMKYNVQF